MLERAALRGQSRTHAYLVLLRVEVAAFHPAALASPWAMRTPRSNRGGVRPTGRTLAADSSLWPCSSARPARERVTDRTAVSRYLALWSPDLPRCRKHRDRPVCLAPGLYGRIGRSAFTPQRHRFAADTSRSVHAIFKNLREHTPRACCAYHETSLHAPLRQ